MSEKWQKDLKKVYPDLKPTRPSGFTYNHDRTAVIIAGCEQPVSMLIAGKDIDSLKMFLNGVQKHG